MHWASSLSKVSPYQLESGVNPGGEKSQAEAEVAVGTTLGLGTCGIWKGPAADVH